MSRLFSRLNTKVKKEEMPPPVKASPALMPPLPNSRDFDETWNYVRSGMDLILRTPRVGMSRTRYIGLVT